MAILTMDTEIAIIYYALDCIINRMRSKRLCFLMPNVIGQTQT